MYLLCYIDVLECNVNNGGCEQNCTNTFDGSYCSCYVNYTLNANNQTCDRESGFIIDMYTYTDIFLFIAVCSDSCGNCLTCDSPDMCTCTQGWTGSDCCKGEIL